MNQRASLVLRKNFKDVRIVDGFAITDRMCHLSAPFDGRHYYALRAMKLSLFFRQVTDVLFDKQLASYAKHSKHNKTLSHADDNDDAKQQQFEPTQDTHTTKMILILAIIIAIALSIYNKKRNR
jgi:hypothetical protein